VNSGKLRRPSLSASAAAKEATTHAVTSDGVRPVRRPKSAINSLSSSTCTTTSERIVLRTGREKKARQQSIDTGAVARLLGVRKYLNGSSFIPVILLEDIYFFTSGGLNLFGGALLVRRRPALEKVAGMTSGMSRELQRDFGVRKIIKISLRL